uniref:F-box domain-containing protein n=1 Tax=Solanum lycopersicum TaxID=4081 RepID=A0A3Q7ETI5_SOLLC
METNYYSSMLSVRDEESDKKYLSSITSKQQIQHNTSTNTRSDKLKKRPSCIIDSKCVPVDRNICIHLPQDLQREISRYLISQEAYMNFRLVCKLWRSIAPPLHWNVVVDDHATPSYNQDSVWLLSLNQNDGLCTFSNFNGYMINNDLVGCEIRYAKDGWLLVSKGKSLFLLEPSGKQIIHLPQKTDEYFCDIMSFSASPTN